MARDMRANGLDFDGFQELQRKDQNLLLSLLHFTGVYMCVCVCVFVYIYMCVCMCVCEVCLPDYFL